jgi:hypothetical protein
MLEIILLVTMCRRLGEKSRAKGHAAGKYQFLLVLFWFGGEIGGAMVAAFLSVVFGVFVDFQGEPNLAVVYGAGIVGAAFGAWGAFKIVNSLPDHSRRVDDSEGDYRDDDEYDDRIESDPRSRDIRSLDRR